MSIRARILQLREELDAILRELPADPAPRAPKAPRKVAPPSAQPSPAAIDRVRRTLRRQGVA